MPVRASDPATVCAVAGSRLTMQCMADYTAQELDQIIRSGGGYDTAYYDRGDLRDYPTGSPLMGDADQPMVFPNDGRPVQYFADYSMNRWARELGKDWVRLRGYSDQ